jgi:hypothetical protein
VGVEPHRQAAFGGQFGEAPADGQGIADLLAEIVDQDGERLVGMVPSPSVLPNQVAVASVEPPTKPLAPDSRCARAEPTLAA